MKQANLSARPRVIPLGHHTATPYLVVRDAGEAIDFYTRAFGAKEVMRVEARGRIGHAQIRIGNSRIMISDEHPETGALSPKSFGGSPVRIFLYVKNADNFVGRAVAIGAKLRQLVDETAYGDRSGSVEDPFGHIWHVATHRRNMSADEMREEREDQRQRESVGQLDTSVDPRS
jgi:PhnB protein